MTSSNDDDMLFLMDYDLDPDSVQVGFLPTAIRVAVDAAMTNGIEAVETRPKWSQVGLIDRLEFAKVLSELVLGWDYEDAAVNQTDFIRQYGGNMVDQAERALLPVMDEAAERDDYRQLLERFPFLGAFGSPFGAPILLTSPTIPSREQADAEWA